jgi:hypothetical protein
VFEKESNLIDEEVYRIVSDLLRVKNSTLIDPNNTFDYAHGRSWTHVDAATGKENVGEFVEHQAEVSISTDKIINNDASVIIEFVQQMAEQMHAQFARSVYEMVGEAAESVGNVAHIEQTPGLTGVEDAAQVRRSLSAMFEKLELGVDEYGVVSYPQLHIHPSNQRIISALQVPETEEEARAVDEVQRKKEAEAMGREAERLRRFRRK